MKLAGCVILYNPDNDVADNIRTYIDYLDKLFVVDNQNGRKVFDELSKVYKNIELVSYAENMGIAKPLNDVLKMAKGNYTHLLTMDQDSFFEEDDIKKYIELAHEIEWSNVLGIAPQYINKNVAKQRKITNDTWNETWSVITSGNIINTANAVTIGGFDENLFIDEVDSDFCYRGWIGGFKILISNDIVWLNHCIGTPFTAKLLWKTLYSMNHNYIRTYYIIRNRIYVVFKDWQIAKEQIITSYFKDTIRLVIAKIFFEQDKLRKIRSIFEGIKDAIMGRMGKKEFKY